jgi:hypothetical protein
MIAVPSIAKKGAHHESKQTGQMDPQLRASGRSGCGDSRRLEYHSPWHPHARFHDALYLLFFDATSLIALWLLWRPSKEPGLGLMVAALFSAAAWTPFFYIEALIPGTSLLAADNVPVLKLAGMTFPPNLIVAAVLFLLTIIAYWLARDTSSNA